MRQACAMCSSSRRRSCRRRALPEWAPRTSAASPSQHAESLTSSCAAAPAPAPPPGMTALASPMAMGRTTTGGRRTATGRQRSSRSSSLALLISWIGTAIEAARRAPSWSSWSASRPYRGRCCATRSCASAPSASGAACGCWPSSASSTPRRAASTSSRRSGSPPSPSASSPRCDSWTPAPCTRSCSSASPRTPSGCPSLLRSSSGCGCSSSPPAGVSRPR
mmetsp:Transcript_116177/g.324916  ORF Transcript_116177/g.324916 Transcript_116177/m.324916 type:complete len:221 (+) Transcript_116177:281-943(+)